MKGEYINVGERHAINTVRNILKVVLIRHA